MGIAWWHRTVPSCFLRVFEKWSVTDRLVFRPEQLWARNPWTAVRLKDYDLLFVFFRAD